MRFFGPLPWPEDVIPQNVGFVPGSPNYFLPDTPPEINQRGPYLVWPFANAATLSPVMATPTACEPFWNVSQWRIGWNVTFTQREFDEGTPGASKWQGTGHNFFYPHLIGTNPSEAPSTPSGLKFCGYIGESQAITPAEGAWTVTQLVDDGMGGVSEETSSGGAGIIAWSTYHQYRQDGASIAASQIASYFLLQSPDWPLNLGGEEYGSAALHDHGDDESGTMLVNLAARWPGHFYFLPIAAAPQVSGGSAQSYVNGTVTVTPETYWIW